MSSPPPFVCPLKCDPRPCCSSPCNPSMLVCKRPLASMSTAFYYPINNIRPCQTNASCLNIQVKYNKIVARGDAVWNGQSFDLKYNDGTAVYPLNKPFEVISSPYGFILTNGTHRTIASIMLGASTMPVIIINDLSVLSREEFVRQATGRYIFPYDLCGNPTRTLVCDFLSLVDNPNRYFAIISARTCKKTTTPNKKTTGADYPLWIRIDQPGVGGFENQIAQALWRSGLVYSNQWGDQIPDWFMERARQVLICNPVPGLCLIRKRTYYNDIPNLCSKCGV